MTAQRCRVRVCTERVARSGFSPPGPADVTWRPSRHIPFCNLGHPIRGYLLNNLSGGGELIECFFAFELHSIFSGEPASGQGKTIPEDPEMRSCRSTVRSSATFSSTAPAGPKSGVMSFFRRRRSWTTRASRRLGAGFPGFRLKNQEDCLEFQASPPL